MDTNFASGNIDDYVERLAALLRRHDVVSVFFIPVVHSLIIDFRRAEGIAPTVLTDPAVSSHQERFHSFARLRPGLPLPETLSLAMWPHSVRFFREAGLLDVLRNRALAETGGGLLHEVDDSYLFLLGLERQYQRDMVRGVGMRTLWQRDRR